MFFEDISFIAVLGGAIASTIVGFIWYAPWFLGKPWMREMGYTPESLAQKKAEGMARTYAFSFLSSILTSYAIAIVMNSIFVSGLAGFALVGLVLSIGFVVAVKFNDRLFSNDSWTLFVINAGYQVAAIVAAAIVIGILG